MGNSPEECEACMRVSSETVKKRQNIAYPLVCAGHSTILHMPGIDNTEKMVSEGNTQWQISLVSKRKHASLSIFFVGWRSCITRRQHRQCCIFCCSYFKINLVEIMCLMELASQVRYICLLTQLARGNRMASGFCLFFVISQLKHRLNYF